ncbi:MAG: hypothetical protein PHV07_06270, partial [Oscillospiraceae bacterium]|nr:hypothetical protein [Oscillospiraceae bacterium]
MNEFSSTGELLSSDDISSSGEISSTDKSFSYEESANSAEFITFEQPVITGGHVFNMAHTKRIRIMTTALLVFGLLFVTCITLWFSGALNGIFNKATQVNAGFVGSDIIASNLAANTSDDNVENAVAKTVPNKFVGATLSAGVDYYGESATFESAQTEI